MIDEKGVCSIFANILYKDHANKSKKVDKFNSIPCKDNLAEGRVVDRSEGGLHGVLSVVGIGRFVIRVFTGTVLSIAGQFALYGVNDVEKYAGIVEQSSG